MSRSNTFHFRFFSALISDSFAFGGDFFAFGNGFLPLAMAHERPRLRFAVAY